MNEWGVFLVIVAVVTFIISIVTIVIKVSNVIQKNTDTNDQLKGAIGGLEETLRDLKTDNKKDHEKFRDDINGLQCDFAAFKAKHDGKDD